ncbi:phosphotransferase [Candidatus Woesearchaeota archaeon]|nr:phosphotransferase [Candidatus Woesearchaeota archaeon]
MKNDHLLERVEGNIGKRVETMQEVNGGYRNRVYLCSTSDEKIIVKCYRPARRRDDFCNETSAYQLFQRLQCHVPETVFIDNENRMLGLRYLPGAPLQEGECSDYYSATIRLLADTYRKTGQVTDSGQFNFQRDPKGIFEGINLLRKHRQFNPSAAFLSLAEQSYALLATTPRRLSLGSFIPSNVVRADRDYHIDLELVSFSAPTDDIAYFSLFSGVNLWEEATHHVDMQQKDDKLFVASLLHLGILTAGIYHAEYARSVTKDQQDMIIRRLINFQRVLGNTNDAGLIELAEAIGVKNDKHM